MTRHIQFVELSSGGVLGGSLTGILELIARLDRQRFSPSLVLFEPKGIEEDLRARGCPVEVLNDLPVAVATKGSTRAARAADRLRELLTVVLPRARALRRVFRAQQPALVYLANGLTSNLDGVVAAASLGLPIICHEKGFRRVGPVERVLSRRVACCICMTDDIADHYRGRGVQARRFRTIFDGIECGRFDATSGDGVRAELGIAADDPLVGLVGHIQEWKGQLLVVEAMAQAHARVPNLRCLLIGGVHRAGQAYADRVRARIAEARLGEHVILTGPRHDVAACMAAMDVVLHASVTPEPFGRVLIEAMASGKPVIAPAEGGPRLIVADGETGVLVPPRDPDALAAAIVDLCERPERRVLMGQAARARVEALFDIDQHVATVQALFDEVLGSVDG